MFPHAWRLAVSGLLLIILTGCASDMNAVAKTADGDLSAGLPIKNLAGQFPDIAPENRFTNDASASILARWLNNRELIFSVVKIEEGLWQSDGQNMTVVTWDTFTGRLTDHMTGNIRCVSSVDGYVQIATRVHREPEERGMIARTEMLRGVWGSELEAYVLMSYGAINPVTCRTIEDERRPKGTPRVIKLYEGHGYLERAGITYHPLNDGKWTYVNPEKGLRVDIPLEDGGHKEVKYLPFNQSYFLYGMMLMTAPQDSNLPRKAHLVNLEGQVTEITVPAPLWQWARRDLPSVRQDRASYNIDPVMSRWGILWSGFADAVGRKGLWRARSGCYLQRDDTLYRIEDGICGTPSPDGCKLLTVRLISKRSYTPKDDVKFEIRDLCKGETPWH